MKKTIRILSLVLVCVLALGLFAGCTSQPEATKPAKGGNYPKLLGQVKKNDVYTDNELYLWNDVTERKIYCREVIPATYKEGDKLPVIIFVHGFNGSADALVNEPRDLAADGIAGFTFECCGGNKVNHKSDGFDIYPSHYTSRAADLETVLAYVKTLPYVDTERIFLYGQSYGGAVCMSTAPRHNSEIAGLILESTGVSEGGGMLQSSGNGEVEDYKVPEDWENYLKSYTGNVLLCNSEGDTTVKTETGDFTQAMYASRPGSATIRYVLCPEGEHAFNSFSAEGKKMTYDAIREMVNATAK